jgi:hypothetical protein
MKVLAVDSGAKTSSMAAVRKGLRQAPPPGWRVLSYSKPSGLVTQLKRLKVPSAQLDEIEIVSEGSPVSLDAVQFETETDYLTVAEFGDRISKLACVHSRTVVYLSGCNTGLRGSAADLRRCIAQSLANTSGTRVRGAAGYISGMHATGTEQCVKEVVAGAVHLPALPNSRDAQGAACWNTFSR